MSLIIVEYQIVLQYI